MATARPSGRVAVSWTGLPRRLMADISSSFGVDRPTQPQSSGSVPEERIVTFRPRTILAVIAIVLGVAILLAVIWISRQVLTWILVSIFLALALNPAVEFFQRRG